MKKVLITGASGFLGKYLIDACLQNGYEVTGIYNNNKAIAKSNPLVHWRKADLLQLEELEPLIVEADCIIHAAAIVSFAKVKSKEMMTFNIESTANLVNLALKYKTQHLVHISSISALGHQKSSMINESFNEHSNVVYSTYGKSKMYSELEVWRGISEGLAACIINPSLILGSGNWKSGSPRMVKTVADGMKYYPTGGTGFVYASDVAECVLKAMQEKITNERILCNGENHSYQHVMNLVADELNVPGPQAPIKPWHIRLIAMWETLKSFISNKESILNGANLRTAQKQFAYSNQKSKELLGIQYTPIKEAVNIICQEYLTSSEG